MSYQTDILLETGTNELEIIEFYVEFPDGDGKMNSQAFGINVAKVREIIRVPEITTLPKLPRGMLGIINLRDQLTPVLDLAQWLFNYEQPLERKKLIISKFNSVQVGFLVHDVRQIHRLSWEQVETPDTIHQIATENSTVVGVIKREDRIIMMLDIEKIIAMIRPQLGIKFNKDELAKFGQNKTILVAEDSPMIRHMIVDRVKNAGFNVLEFTNGRSAMDKLLEFSELADSPEALSKHIDLVITDIEMPKMDGYSLTKQVKENPVLNKLPVIIFSSMITPESLHKGKSVGADFQISKPQLPNLLGVLQDLLEKR